MPDARAIEKALGEVYSHSGKTKGTMIEALADDLSARWDTLVERAERMENDLVTEVMLVIWNWYPGGGTAEIAAGKVMAAVGEKGDS